MFGFGLGVARQDNCASVGGRQMNIDHLHAFELFQYSARGKARSQFVESATQSHIQAVSDKGHEDFTVNPFLELMKNGTDGQIPLEVAEGFLDLGQLDIKLPELGRLDAKYIRAQ